MPTRWIVFRVINYLVMLSVSLQAIIFLIRIEQSTSDEWTIYLILLACIGVLLTNSIFNVIWLERFYPAQIPSAIFKRASMILFILSILVLALFILSLCVLIYNVWLSQYSSDYLDWRTLLNFLLLLFTSIGGIYLLIYRNILTRLIKHNQRLQFNNFPETNVWILYTLIFRHHRCYINTYHVQEYWYISNRCPFPGIL